MATLQKWPSWGVAALLFLGLAGIAAWVWGLSEERRLTKEWENQLGELDNRLRETELAGASFLKTMDSETWLPETTSKDGPEAMTVRINQWKEGIEKDFQLKLGAEYIELFNLPVPEIELAGRRNSE